MGALDFGSAGRGPTFFGGNIGSLSQVLAGVTEVRVTEEERGGNTVQTVVYELGR
jgi:hypothetical protein